MKMKFRNRPCSGILLLSMKYMKEHAKSIIVIGALLILSFILFAYVDAEAMRLAIESAGPWAPILYIIAKISTVVFAPLSGTILYVFSVPIFGFWPAVAYSLIGDFIGATITFYLSRFYGRPVVQYFMGQKNMIHIENALEIMSTRKGFVSMRLAAISMPEIASYAAGLTKIAYTPFILIHMGVNLFPTFVLCATGLFIGSDTPAWLSAVGIATVGLVTVGSIAVFVFMLKRENDKKKNTTSL